MKVDEYLLEDGSSPYNDGLDVEAAAKVTTATVRMERGLNRQSNGLMELENTLLIGNPVIESIWHKTAKTSLFCWAAERRKGKTKT